MLIELGVLLLALHGLGAALGAGGSLFAEIFYAKATADGHLDRREREWFRTTYFALRWGMTIVLLTGIALIVVQYFLPNSPTEVLHPAIWMQNILALVIVGFASALARKQVSWETGASAIFAGWWMIFMLTVWQGKVYSLLTLSVMYVVLALLSMGFWGYVASFARVRSLTAVVREMKSHERTRQSLSPGQKM